MRGLPRLLLLLALALPAAAQTPALESLRAEAARLSRAADPEAWGDAKAALGRALLEEGIRLADPALLLEAASVLRDSSDATPRDRRPQDWAARQYDGAQALEQLGRIAGDPSIVAAAIAGYDRAAEVWTRASGSQRWAALRAYRSDALVLLAELRGGDLATLAEAEAGFAEAMQVASPTQSPRLWAHLRIGRADAMRLRGARTGDEGPVRAAIDLLREVLDRLPQDRDADLRGMANINLGTASQALAGLVPRQAAYLHLVNARRALVSAAAILPRAEDPQTWALAQQRLGEVLSAMAGIAQREDFRQAALRAFEAALEERTRERAPVDWARTRIDMAVVLDEMGAGEAQVAAAYRDALGVLTPARAPLAWARANAGLGELLSRRALAGGEIAVAEAAIGHYRAAIAVWTQAANLREWALDRFALGQLLLELGERTGEAAPLREALALAEAVIPVMPRVFPGEDEGSRQLREFVDMLRDEARAKLAGR